ncbi:lmo0954 family membrane protein [Metabacillus malikii]|uniref:Lia operon protein LiaI n=1 Tax=Metabacillus malikii TaxID=1504265 RepID=A0ABT9ZEZ0_9BACI|nr:flagellar basal body rod protein [Metabacillus malikii]MDQ0230813.1 lia operon protein LiaI [Metabacillus malikii]
MKKFGYLLLGGVAAIVLLSNLAPMIALAISLTVMYFAYKGFIKTDSTFTKVLLATIGIIALFASASNLPAVIGVVAVYVLYVVYKKWNNKPANSNIIDSDDPFTNFEKEWNSIKGNY